MYLKQLSDCSHSESDKYTENRMKLVEGECFSEEKEKSTQGSQELCGFS